MRKIKYNILNIPLIETEKILPSGDFFAILGSGPRAFQIEKISPVNP